MLGVIALWIVGVLLLLAPPVSVIMAGLTLCAVCGMICQAVSTGYVTMTAKEGRSSAVGLYATRYYVGGSAGAFLTGLAWTFAGWNGLRRHHRRHAGDHRDHRRRRVGAVKELRFVKEENAMVSESQFAFLRSIDTPTVCNLIEIVAPERRGAGYTAVHLHCPFPDLPPMVGFAKTVTIRARDRGEWAELHAEADGLPRLCRR